MLKKLTITLDDAVYNGLHAIIGRGHISRFLNDLARPHVIGTELDESYRAKAADEAGEREALEWSNALIVDVADERHDA